MLAITALLDSSGVLTATHEPLEKCSGFKAAKIYCSLSSILDLICTATLITVGILAMKGKISFNPFAARLLIASGSAILMIDISYMIALSIKEKMFEDHTKIFSINN